MPTTLEQLDPAQRLLVTQLVTKMYALGYKARFSHLETGPVITQLFFAPDPYAPLSKILNRGEDLALSAGVEAVLITREREFINVSVPRAQREVIKFDSLVHKLSSFNMRLPVLMGQRPTGEPFALDLCDAPHMLIAGSTGSGKSTFISQVILSLALLKKPGIELKLLLVDTKSVDLPLFSSLPHVITCVTDIKELHKHLDAMLNLVRQRLETMRGVARNIHELRALHGPGARLPYYVVIIDEFADIMGLDQELAREEDKETKRTRINAKICRIAQISRAAGVHIIAATQRPSYKIISGDIKTNFPTRISFRLPTGIDSRIILDASGAEYLLGKGDFLFRDAQNAEPQRGHSSYISLDDIAKYIQQEEDIRNALSFAKENYG